MEVTKNGSIICDKPEDIAFYRLVALKGALSLEVNTGMRMHRGVSTLEVARQYGFTGRTKKQALEFITALVEEVTA